MIIFQQHQAAFPPPAYPFGLLPQPAPTFKCPWCPAVFDNREVKLDSNLRLSTFVFDHRYFKPIFFGGSTFSLSLAQVMVHHMQLHQLPQNSHQNPYTNTNTNTSSQQEQVPLVSPSVEEKYSIF